MSKTMNLEGAVKRLEEIAAQMGGELSIDDSIKLYAEAVKLLDFANGKLEAAAEGGKADLCKGGA